jgi:hypothetical protein
MTKSTLDRLTTLGEDVLGKASQNPNLSRVVQGATQLRDRVDELQKRVRGLEGLERRLAEVEGRLAKLERATRRPAAAKKADSSPKTDSKS